jgi:sarcosine oxidase
LHRTGGLVLGHADSPFLAGTRAAAREYGIAHEDLDAAMLRRRYPMFVVDEQTEGYLEPTAGYVRPETAVMAQLDLAARHGARLHRDERVTAWTATGHGVTVRSERCVVAASELVLCPGPWITGLVPELADLVEVQRQCLFWFPVGQGYPKLERMPVFIWDFGGARPEFAHGVGFYGFPAIDGPAGGLKVGTEISGESVDPDLCPAVSSREAHEMHANYVARRLPWLGAEPLRAATCFYTSTRGSRFIVDRHPSHANVTVVSACSGHGFKHSPAIGEAVAELIVDGTARLDLAPFGFERQRYGAGSPQGRNRSPVMSRHGSGR